MASRILETHWQVFARGVLPRNCSSSQRRDMENAFKCGMVDMFALLTTELRELTDVEAERRLDLLHDEITQYARLLERRAIERIAGMN